jgi:hypothetical protein
VVVKEVGGSGVVGWTDRPYLVSNRREGQSVRGSGPRVGRVWKSEARSGDDVSKRSLDTSRIRPGKGKPGHEQGERGGGCFQGTDYRPGGSPPFWGEPAPLQTALPIAYDGNFSSFVRGEEREGCE